MNLSRLFVRLALTASVVSMLTCSVLAQEARLKKKQVPRAVIAAFQSAYPQATMRGFAREKENGKVYYEVESIEGQTTRDVLYNADGTVAEIEEGIAVGDLPAAAVEGLRANTPEPLLPKQRRLRAATSLSMKLTRRSVRKEWRWNLTRAARR
jgi:hypothetical protein